MGSPESSPPDEPCHAVAADDAPAVLVHVDAPPAVQDIRDTLVVKEGDLFLLSDLEGNLPRHNPNGLGLYYEDTRFLSALELEIQGLKPTILLSTTRDRAVSSQVLTNPNLTSGDGRRVHEQTVQIRRHRRLTAYALRESLYFENFNPFPLRLVVALHADADFADMFEVRGIVEGVRRPPPEPVTWDGRALRFAQQGLDGVLRCTTLTFDPVPDRVVGGSVHFDVELAARGRGPRRAWRLDLVAEVDEVEPRPTRPPPRARVRRDPVPTDVVRIETSSPSFDAIFETARRDVRMLVAGHGEDVFVAAGTPWYATLFGRDSIIAALHDLWIAPASARGTLRLLARYQGTRSDPSRDEEPGKILHELRRGDLARQGLVPFDPYYGTADATPLWIVLLGAYHELTGDLDLVRELRPNLEAALHWIDHYGDLDGDGFVEYHSRSGSGLVSQGWKDSWDAIVHADGTVAEPPIALVEVQAYVYAAKRRAAALLAALGDTASAARLTEEATRLQLAFESAFWMPAEGTYCLALDGKKRQVGVVASNAGHALWCGIAGFERGTAVARRLMQEDSFSGWGIRTLSAKEIRYNPAGYHTGTVWPHDNALIALGFKRYGQEELLLELVTGMHDAARRFPGHRMPELFCGYARSAFGEPVRYPVACSPQAWAATSWSAFLQAMLGLRVDGSARELRILRPSLPRWLERVHVRHLSVGPGTVDLRYERTGDRASVDVVSMRGDVRVTFVNEEHGP